MSHTPFALNPVLTAVAIGYKNQEDDLIADKVMPRVQTAHAFTWTEYDSAQAYTVPDTKVGRRSEPNTVTFSGTDKTDVVVDYGLDDPIPMRDIEAFAAMPKPQGGGGPIDPKSLSGMMLTNLILLDREIRVATAAQSPSNFNSANIRNLTAAEQWSDPASDPFGQILEALDTPLIRPNTFIVSRNVWRTLRQHPRFVAQVRKNKDGAGALTMQEVAEGLEVAQVLVGSGRVNTARKGQPVNMQRVWGTGATLIHSSALAAQTMQPTWGWTAQFGSRFGAEIPDPKKGLKGSVTVRIGEQVKEVVAAKGAGFLFTNTIAA